MLTVLQKRTSQAIIKIFETSKALGNYGQVTSVDGDRGGLSYGTNQATLNGGNLYLLIKAYTEAPGAQFAGVLKPYLDRLRDKDQKLNKDKKLHDILRQAGNDPVMMTTQDAFFERAYWQPAENKAVELGLTHPLSYAVMYDGRVHGSLGSMITRTNQQHGSLAALGEQRWLELYLQTRRAWLAAQPAETQLPLTVYRMDAFLKIIQQGNWALDLPMTVRGVQLYEELLMHAEPAVNASAEDGEELMRPVLRFNKDKPMSGNSVELLQRGLKLTGHDVLINSQFDAKTESAVKQFQLAHGLAMDGIVGPQTYTALDAEVAAAQARTRQPIATPPSAEIIAQAIEMLAARPNWGGGDKQPDWGGGKGRPNWGGGKRRGKWGGGDKQPDWDGEE